MGPTVTVRAAELHELLKQWLQIEPDRLVRGRLLAMVGIADFLQSSLSPVSHRAPHANAYTDGTRVRGAQTVGSPRTSLGTREAQECRAVTGEHRCSRRATRGMHPTKHPQRDRAGRRAALQFPTWHMPWDVSWHLMP